MLAHGFDEMGGRVTVMVTCSTNICSMFRDEGSSSIEC